LCSSTGTTVAAWAFDCAIETAIRWRDQSGRNSQSQKLGRWEPNELVENSGVALSTARRMESRLGPVRVYGDNLCKVQCVLERASNSSTKATPEMSVSG
jgi:hypothetical protein